MCLVLPYAVPDTVIKHAAPAGTCTASAPVIVCVPAAAYAAPDTVIKHVAPSPAGICAAPAPVTVYAPTAHAAPTPVTDYVDSSPVT